MFFFFFCLLAGTARLSKKQRGDSILFWSQLFWSPQRDRICGFLCSPGPTLPGPLPRGPLPGDSAPLSLGPTVSCPARPPTPRAPPLTWILGPASSVAGSSEVPMGLGFGLRAWGLCRPQQNLTNCVAQNSRNPFSHRPGDSESKIKASSGRCSLETLGRILPCLSWWWQGSRR